MNPGLHVLAISVCKVTARLRKSCETAKSHKKQQRVAKSSRPRYTLYYI